MVAWSDGVLAALAYVSMLVATLRTGSRVLYLLEHKQIGVMEGPLILGPDDVAWQKENETLEISPLWELSNTFQQSVRLALDPGSMEYRVLSVEKPEREIVVKEPYNLSPFPVRKANEEHGTETPTDDTVEPDSAVDIDISVQDIVATKSNHKLSRRLPYFSSVSFGSIVRRIPGVSRWMGESDDASEEDTWLHEENGVDGTLHQTSDNNYQSLLIHQLCFFCFIYRMGL